MKKLLFDSIIYLSLLTFIFVKPCEANPTPFGLGAAIGDPSGLALKLWLDQNPSRALDAMLAWNTSTTTSFYFHGDYLVHDANIIKVKLPHPINIYYGGGFLFKNQVKNNKTKTNESVIGIRAPIGLSYLLSDPRFEFFGELGGNLEIIPNTNVSINFNLGVRYFF